MKKTNEKKKVISIIALIVLSAILTGIFGYEMGLGECWECWDDIYTLLPLVKSCTDNAPKQNCSYMEYPKHRWDYETGMWICNE